MKKILGFRISELGVMFGGLAAVTLFFYAFGQQTKDVVLVAPYFPTPMEVAERMLEIGELQPGELHYDLGSGDGRIVILAAQKFGARSIGFEIDSALVERSRLRIEELNLTERASIAEEDLFKADFSKPDLITVYLLKLANAQLKPLFEQQLHEGARVVAHDFPIPDWEPEQTVRFEHESDYGLAKHVLYLYRR